MCAEGNILSLDKQTLLQTITFLILAKNKTKKRTLAPRVHVKGGRIYKWWVCTCGRADTESGNDQRSYILFLYLIFSASPFDHCYSVPGFSRQTQKLALGGGPVGDSYDVMLATQGDLILQGKSLPISPHGSLALPYLPPLVFAEQKCVNRSTAINNKYI